MQKKSIMQKFQFQSYDITEIQRNYDILYDEGIDMYHYIHRTCTTTI